jgi:hypothetical protein
LYVDTVEGSEEILIFCLSCLGNNIFEPGKEGSGYKGSGSGSGDKEEVTKSESEKKDKESKS